MEKFEAEELVRRPRNSASSSSHLLICSHSPKTKAFLILIGISTMPVPSLSELQRRLTASAIYGEPLKPWETRALRLEPVHGEYEEGEIVEVRLETAVIPHLEGLGLVDSGDMILHEALSYTWGSPVLSHAIRCNGLDFSVTTNLHAALVHLRGSHGHRWL